MKTKTIVTRSSAPQPHRSQRTQVRLVADDPSVAAQYDGQYVDVDSIPSAVRAELERQGVAPNAKDVANAVDSPGAKLFRRRDRSLYQQLASWRLTEREFVVSTATREMVSLPDGKAKPLSQWRTLSKRYVLGERRQPRRAEQVLGKVDVVELPSPEIDNDAWDVLPKDARQALLDHIPALSAQTFGTRYRQEHRGGRWLEVIEVVRVTDYRIAYCRYERSQKTSGHQIWMWKVEHIEELPKTSRPAIAQSKNKELGK